MEKGIWKYMKTAPKDKEIVGLDDRGEFRMKWVHSVNDWSVDWSKGDPPRPAKRWRMLTAQEQSDEHQASESEA